MKKHRIVYRIAALVFVFMLVLCAADIPVKASGTNIPYDVNFSLGNDGSEIRFNWLSPDNNRPEVQITKSSNMKDGKFGTGSAVYGTVNAVSAAPGIKDYPDSTEKPTGEYADKVVVSGLAPSTRYTYRVGDGTTWSKTYTFTTGAPGSGFSFAAFGDLQIGDFDNNISSPTPHKSISDDQAGWADTLKKVTTKYPSINFFLVLGDQINEYDNLVKQQEQYVSFFNPDPNNNYLQNYPLVTIEGNHDHSMGKYYSCHFNPPNLSTLGQTENNNVKNGDGDYWFIYHNVLFMILDANAPNDTAAHDQFMKQAVAANPNVKWKIAAWHQSAYSAAGGSDNSTLFIRQNWSKLMDKYGVDVVFQGHDHCYTRTYQMLGDLPVDTTLKNTVTNPKGTVYFTLDSSSGSKYYTYASSVKLAFNAVSWQQYVPTYSYITIDDTHFKITTFRTDTGDSIDTYSITKTGLSQTHFPITQQTNSSATPKNETGDQRFGHLSPVSVVVITGVILLICAAAALFTVKKRKY
ncbi:MAG: metallophosphoesterase family protein [Clostridiaceae bacterium]